MDCEGVVAALDDLWCYGNLLCSARDCRALEEPAGAEGSLSTPTSPSAPGSSKDAPGEAGRLRVEDPRCSGEGGNMEAALGAGARRARRGPQEEVFLFDEEMDAWEHAAPYHPPGFGPLEGVDALPAIGMRKLSSWNQAPQEIKRQALEPHELMALRQWPSVDHMVTELARRRKPLQVCWRPVTDYDCRRWQHWAPLYY